MPHKKSLINRNNHLRVRLIGKKVTNQKISISERNTDFFEDIPLYRGDRTRRLGKIHLSRSRKSKSTKT